MSFQNPIPLRLKEARKEAKLSQKALGVRIGMDESSASPRMNQYEKGKHTPDVQTLKLMADELDVPLSYFFCEDEDSAELVVLINKLPKQEKKALIESLTMKINKI
ncbi:helix-turn-helix transcriptional regulator [Vibrio cholerae]|uniref:helix-turn-helix domain-containing protein n=1 Tax=Vibrio cholerae TaxID=666 RepID=UPI000B494E8A|nr:helix-turn-helix transcriptional regulator [Vibrio cholerae]ELW1717135.1 helix-turn-helix transcriptional regulator [Vibrio cholerae]MCX9592392.1 helix-turn-helix transcriptional regulator [Vibrio cholerae]MUH70657.1 helix-turn-helix domain-containing protein [Vibrio cholerae]QBJ28450.1 XRE family transcriptional regulator [Vibrio cholerae]TYW31643.1 helix-turn-helix transcriptional regulator [Vibrio cholerae]